MGRKEEILAAVDQLAEELAAKLPEDEKLKKLFINCFKSTASTTTVYYEEEDTYIFTGDIEAMWLRDSSAQVVHYLPFLKRYPELASMVRGLIGRQTRYIALDAYANAFNEEANGRCWEHDSEDQSPWVWERKYEVDSLCYPVWLIKRYYEETGDGGVFTEAVKEMFRTVIRIWRIEQEHAKNSDYDFTRDNCPPGDTLVRGGKGSPVAYTGMTWSGFRPSDDACVYHYLVPSNMFAAVVLDHIQEFAADMYGDPQLAEEAGMLCEEIRQGIGRYGIQKYPGYGRIYAYETDGLGHYNFMDDANVPSLLAMPWIGYEHERGTAPGQDEIYQNTRKFLLSRDNPYYFEGNCACGIGSPHTPDDYIWHIGLVMQGLTAASRDEKERILETLLETDADTGFMHEGFDCNDPGKFTRPWFAWANSLFALFVLENFIS